MPFFILSFFMSLLSAQSFNLENMNDGAPSTRTMYSYQGSGVVQVIEFFFNRCPACNENQPNIEALYQQFKGRENFSLVEISRDNRTSEYFGNNLSWIDRYRPAYPVLNNGSLEVIRAYGVTAFPTMVIRDCKGTEIERHVGSLDWEQTNGVWRRLSVEEFAERRASLYAKIDNAIDSCSVEAGESLK